MDLSAFIFKQLWPIHHWRCEEIDCILRHRDDLLLHNSTVAIICPYKHLHCNIREYTAQFLPYVSSMPITPFPLPALTFTLKFLVLIIIISVKMYPCISYNLFIFLPVKLI